MEEVENCSEMTLSTATVSGEGTGSLYENQTVPLSLPPPKKKRNLPGMPDPDAEVIALSPKALLATNRFVCEICNKGFQRDQNLQLHRRGHNLPWKLKQRTSKEPRKRVYVCPEASCVHHNPARALGDLTGIKKHFCRKHGEKKWKCERCSKKYAVQSDWKAHMKTCGTREYKCDCGTLFSRRDSFITHRAFCDALAEESARAQTLTIMVGKDGGKEKSAVPAAAAVASPPPPPLTPSTTVVSPGLSAQSSELAENPVGVSTATPGAAATCLTVADTSTNSTSATTSNVFASVFASSTPAPISQQTSASSFSDLLSALTPPDYPTKIPTHTVLEPPSLSLSSSLYLSNNVSPLFQDQEHRHYTQSTQPAAMSATALLQKAAQMGATSSNTSLLRGLGLQVSSSSSQDNNQWDVKPNASAMAAAGLGLGLHSGDFMIGSSPLFASKPTTLDLFGLGLGGGSALLNSYGGSFSSVGAVAPPYGRGGGGGSEETWDGAVEKKLNGPG